MTSEKLNKIDACRHLLPDPGPEVVGELVTEIRRLRTVAHEARVHLQELRPGGPSGPFNKVNSLLKSIADD